MFKHINAKSAIVQFIISSGAMRVTDPCYAIDTWCVGTINNVKNGNWLAQVGYYSDPFDQTCKNNYRNAKRKELATLHEEEVKRYIENYGEDEFAKVKDNFKTASGIELSINERQWAEADKNDRGCVAYIRVTHEDHKPDLEADFDQNFEVSTIDVGVDSGQAGMFDLAKYTEALKGQVNNRDDPVFEEFYHKGCCALTSNEHSFGALEFGAVASSGYGDGSYTLFFRKVDDLIVDAYIVFIGDPEEQDEESVEIPIEIGA